MLPARLRNVPLRLILSTVAFGAIALFLVPEDFGAVRSIKIAELPAATAPAFNIAPVPAAAVGKAPVMSAPEVSRPAETAAVGWRPGTPIPRLETVAQVTSVDASPAEPAGLRTDLVNAAVNVHTQGRKDAPVLFVLSAGAQVRVAEAKGGWVHVYSDSGSGWVAASFVGSRPKPQPDAAQQASGGRAMRVAAAVTVFDAPQGAPAYMLEAGDRIRIVETDGKWARIVTATGEGGWVRLR